MKKLYFLASCIGLLLLSGCTSSPPYEDVKAMRKNHTVTPISKGDELSLTYRFSPMMVKDERKAFYDYLQKEDNQKEVTSYLQDAINTSKGVGLASLTYTKSWNKAYLTGDLLHEAGVTALIGASMSLATNWLTARHHYTGNYWVYDENPDNLSDKQITEKYRRKTIDSIYAFAKAYQYDIKCTFNCVDGLPDISKARTVMMLESKNKTYNGKYKPGYLSVNCFLDDLVKAAHNEDAILLNQDYNYQPKNAFEWNVNVQMDDVYEENKKPYPMTLSNGMQVYGESPFPSTRMGNLFFRFMTEKLPGYSVYYYDGWDNSAFFNGKSYKLKDELENNSIIEGLLTMPEF